MPNTFGTSSVQVPLVDPRGARKLRQRFLRELIREINYANSIYVPGGREPARGWILLGRDDYNTIRAAQSSGYGINYQLNLTDFTNSITLKNLAIVQARCVTRGIASDASALYLLELTDRRGVLRNEWVQFPANAYYNVLSPAYPTQYYANSLNSGSPWTWSQAIGDLWSKMTEFLSTYPGLPNTPLGVPTNWNLPGVSAWDAMNDMLDHIGLGISCDLQTATPYGIVSLGASDTTFNTLTTTYSGQLEDDWEWIDVGSGRVPRDVIVYFHRVNEYYGTEETVRRDNLQWQTGAVYPVTITSPATFAGATGTHHIWDEFPVRYDIDGNPLAADVATAATIAQERVNQYFDYIYSRTSGYMNRMYSGIVPFYAGSQVDGVCWKMDFKHRLGWQTQILRGDLWHDIFK